MAIAVPDGLIPVKVTIGQPGNRSQAQLTWVGGGGRVETVTNANGDALMEGVGTSGGTLTIRRGSIRRSKAFSTRRRRRCRRWR